MQKKSHFFLCLKFELPRVLVYSLLMRSKKGLVCDVFHTFAKLAWRQVYKNKCKFAVVLPVFNVQKKYIFCFRFVCCFRRFHLRFLTFWKKSIFLEKFKLEITFGLCLYHSLPIKYGFKIVHIPVLTRVHLQKIIIWWQNVYHPDITALIDWV